MFVVFDPNGVSRPYQLQSVASNSAVKAVQEINPISSEERADPDRHRKSTNPYLKLDLVQPPKRILYAGDLMTAPVYTLLNTDTVGTAQKIFKDRRYRHIPVLNAEGKLVGILSDRDLLRQLSLTTLSIEKDPITSMMKTNVISAAPETDIRNVAKLMFEEHIGSLPIINQEFSLVGLVTRSDILRGLLKHGPLELWG